MCNMCNVCNVLDSSRSIFLNSTSFFKDSSVAKQQLNNFERGNVQDILIDLVKYRKLFEKVSSVAELLPGLIKLAKIDVTAQLLGLGPVNPMYILSNLFVVTRALQSKFSSKVEMSNPDQS